MNNHVDINIYRGMSKGPVSFETTRFIRDACLCLQVQRAARALARRFDGALQPLGLTNGQFSLLMSLNRPEPPTMGAVASLLAMDRTTLTAALKPLERRGLVEVTVNPEDKRRRLLCLTAEGHGLLGEALPLWQRAHQELEALLDQGERERLRASLHLLTASP